MILYLITPHFELLNFFYAQLNCHIICFLIGNVTILRQRRDMTRSMFLPTSIRSFKKEFGQIWWAHDDPCIWSICLDDVTFSFAPSIKYLSFNQNSQRFFEFGAQKVYCIVRANFCQCIFWLICADCLNCLRLISIL